VLEIVHHAAPAIVSLHIGADRYDLLVGARLKSARIASGWTANRLAAGLADVLGVAVSVRELTDWEDGREAFRAGVLPAALDLMGISEAELVGLSNPDAVEVSRLASAVISVRALLNDPAALMRRATALLDGTAKPLLAMAVTLSIATAPGILGHSTTNHVRRANATVAMAREDLREVFTNGAS
jgi:transcriptional regulator with XRE-family HTH domain